MDIDFFNRSDIENDMYTIEKILSTNVFSPENAQHPLMKSAFIELLICLRDLMYKVEKYSTRINFNDDVVANEKITDITDLIKFVRDALCHPDIPHHYLIKDKIKASFNIAYGKCNIMSIGDIVISSDYADDICFSFGEEKIYLKRHIERAFNEAKQKLSPLI
ncbi:hypothetical protein [Clostridium tagluense]|uniref:hypothetical protein n=1 Tax=Clostridium tagluense TaxID=360422 RepID=UPI001CF21D02|nr:hypothetical protein [Clostridium tagluense]MCB2300664.1 hypothetical protein [Clostridium tagluense]